MQEPQCRSAGVRELLDAVGRAKVPCMSIMNMPPLAYLRRIPGLDANALKPAYTDASVWDNVDPSRITLCSPDPQAIRPPDEKVNVLQVTLPTNFKVARFPSEQHTALLRQLQDEIEAIRFDTPDGKVELPVKLKVYDSLFVPLAKWAMLLVGHYRCVTKDGMTAQEAVHSDIETSRSVYNFVVDLCVKLGAKLEDLVPFEKYAAAAQSLTRPASAARALQNGAPNIERVDKCNSSLRSAACIIGRSTRRSLWSTRGSRPTARKRRRNGDRAGGSCTARPREGADTVGCTGRWIPAFAGTSGNSGRADGLARAPIVTPPRRPARS
jgi:hypothetical protein